MSLRTEFEFVLPKGFVDADGRLHRRGRMRLATGRDELEPLRDGRINGADDPYLTERQKRVLLDVYASFVSEADAPGTTVPAPETSPAPETTPPGGTP